MAKRDADRSNPDSGSDARSLLRIIGVLEFVANRGGASANEIAEGLDIPLSTVYRLMNSLARHGYLVHLRADQRFELGTRLHALGQALHRQVPIPSAIREVVEKLHATTAMASYFAIYRGPEVMVAFVSDCKEHPRLKPLEFGFHEAAHATAFGKIMLSGMDLEQRDEYLQARGMPRITSATITDREVLEENLRHVATQGIAWEWSEFVPKMACAAVAVRSAAGLVVGTLAISAPVEKLRAERKPVESQLRLLAGQASRIMRQG